MHGDVRAEVHHNAVRDESDKQTHDDLRQRPRVDEDEQARERQAPATFKNDKEIAARLVLCEQELQVLD